MSDRGFIAGDLLERIGPAIAERYEVVRELGRGGIATVYLARDLRHDRRVAFKIMRSIVAEEEVDRFLGEIRITARLVHPHVLTLLDSGDANGHCYYVTPYMEGESLRQLLILEKQLPVDVALQLTRQVASALDYAHRQGVIHHDIKPENILLSGTHAVVADFGIARAVDKAGVTGAERHGALGTMAYMSPEQVMNSPDIDGRCDIYSLGCTLFEMLAGRTPFVGLTPQELADQQLNAPPPSITSLRQLVSPEVAGVLNRMLAKTPADRFSSAGELVAALASLGATATPTPPAGYSVYVTPPAGAAGQTNASGRKTILGGLRFPRWLAIAALVAFVISLPAILLQRRTASTLKSAGDVTPFGPSLAVLPFDNLSGGDDAQYFADGMTEELIAQLAAVPDLKVISRTSVSALKRAGLTLPQIADTLHVRHVLEGSVRRSGSNVRVTAQLIDPRTDAHLWSQSYDRQLTDAFAVQEEIARNVSTLLNLAVQGLGSQATMPRTKNAGAYDAYLQGKFMLRDITPDGLRRTLAALRQAIALDSGYAPAYSALAHAYSNVTALTAPGSVDPYRVYALMRLLSDRAIAIDASLADAYARRGESRFLAFADLDSAMADFEHALELQPNSANLQANYAHALAVRRRYHEAEDHSQRALTLDPLSPGAHLGYAAVSAAAGRWDVVVAQAREARKLAEPIGLPDAYEAAGLLMSNQSAECVKLRMTLWRGLRAACLHALNRRAEETALVDSLKAEAGPSGGNWLDAFGMTLYYAAVGNAAEWARWFEHGIELTPELYFGLIIDSQLYDPIRRDPLFERTLEKSRQIIRRRFAEQYAQIKLEDALRPAK